MQSRDNLALKGLHAAGREHAFFAPALPAYAVQPDEMLQRIRDGVFVGSLDRDFAAAARAIAGKVEVPPLGAREDRGKRVIAGR